MFRKLVSGLPFSPALVGQLGFYAKRLKKEQVTRRIGLAFTVLALIVQSFAVFTPPDQALASSASDIVPGGVSSVEQILSLYDAGAQGRNDFKALMDYFGVTRTELAALRLEKTCSKDRSIVSFGRSHIFSASEGEVVHRVPTPQGGVSTFYSTPLYLHDRFNGGSFCTDSFVGSSAAVGWFSIMKKCGNFQIKQEVRRLPKASFISASCKTIQGFAYDERQTSQAVKVYLFIGGPPGQGTQYGPFVANESSPSSPAGAGHGFSFTVPEQYQKSATATTVWGVMQPLAGWNEPTVQFSNTTTIPGGCTPQVVPIADCTSLKVQVIERTKFKLSATATAANGAVISGYHYQVVDTNGKLVFEKLSPSNQNQFTSDTFELKEAGNYTAKVTVKTSAGDKTNANCSQPLKVSPPNKCKYNPDLNENDPECKPCPYNKDIWVKDEDCGPKIAQSKEAKNLTQGVQASSITAKAADRIEYVLNTANLSDVAVTTNIEESLADVLEYGTLFENGGGNFNNDTKVLAWQNVTIQPGKSDTRRIIIQVADVIPTTPTAGNNPSSYNCIMTNAYGNTINIKMDCPLAKAVENTVQRLPSTGPGENMLFGAGLLMVVTYFYTRSRQMAKETHLLRKEFSGGTVN